MKATQIPKVNPMPAPFLSDSALSIYCPKSSVPIKAFIGTEDLGQYILKALSDKNGAGIGLTLGICVAFIGLIFDNLIRTWVNQRKKHLGIQ